MKSLFVFLIGIIALVSAKEYPSQKQIEEIQQKFEDAVQKIGAICKIHEEVGKELINNDEHQHFLYEYQIKDAEKRYTDLARQYICEKKQTVKEFEPLAVGYLELQEDMETSICKNVYYANKEAVSAGNVSSEYITELLKRFNPQWD